MDETGPWRSAASAAGLLAGEDVRPTIFARMSALAAELGAMNLGQGFPDTDPPPVVAEAAVRAIRDGVNQYPPGPGMPALRTAIADHQRRFYGLDVDPLSEVLVTTGATEAIAASILALVRPGDEVLTLEPYYDSYGAMIALAGGTHRTVPLHVTTGEDGDLHVSVDVGSLRAAITDRTRMVLLNSPHNPTGLMLDRPALTAIVESARAHDALLVADEVYEHLTFACPHVPVATIPGARERTITIGSAGKTLSVTGWKIGWITAPAELVTAVTGVKQWLTFASGAPFQGAVAAGLAMADGEFATIREDLQHRRDLLVEGLRSVGAKTTVPEAGYFAVADMSDLGEEDGAALCERLPHEAGVVAIPVTAFCRPGTKGMGPLVRLAFCKDEQTLIEAISRLRSWAASRSGHRRPPSPVPGAQLP